MAVLILSLSLIFFFLARYISKSYRELNDSFMALHVSKMMSLCQIAVGELMITNKLGRLQDVMMKQEATFAEIENYLQAENLEGAIIHDGRVVFSTVNLSDIERIKGYKGTVKLKGDGVDYYGYYMHFSAWNLYLVALRSENAYWKEWMSARKFLALIAVVYLFLVGAVFLILRINLQSPLRKMLGELKTQGRITYRSGTEELDTLSVTIDDKLASVRKLTNAIEQATEMILIVDYECIIEYVNPAFEHITGYSKDEALGQTPFFTKADGHGADFCRSTGKFLYEGNPWNMVIESRKKTGELFLEEINITPLRDFSGRINGFVILARNITERIRIEEQLRQSQKMESLGLLAGGIAHDFNNILTVISGYTEMLLEGLKDDKTLFRYAEVMKNTSERATSLVSQLLAFSRKQVLERQVINLNNVVTDTEKILRSVLRDDIILDVRLADDLHSALADHNQIFQVILNLVVNARDAMPQGGQLLIQTENADIVGMLAETQEHLMPGRYATLSVSDTGVGMSEEVKRRIFEPFFSTKGTGKGTGLGLSIIFGIVKQHGGDISVFSEPGRGTTFRIYLPAVDAETTQTEKGPT